jgi:hypothetical protein
MMKMRYIYTTEYYSVKKKRMKCYHLDGIEGHYVKQNKPDTERQVPYNLIYLCKIRSPSHRTTEWNSDHYRGNRGEGAESRTIRNIKTEIERRN